MRSVGTLDPSELAEIRSGSHVCWVVDDSESYTPVASALISNGIAAGEKVFAFGPAGDTSIADRDDVTFADPRLAFLGGGPLQPDTMYAMFREQFAAARAEGYEGLRVVADMDWMLPAGPTADDVVAFELMLDRVIDELGATVVCAYRTTSFDDDVVSGTASVHPLISGADEPQFTLVAGDDRSWTLTGEIDATVVRAFRTAIATATSGGACVIDVEGLRFVDVGGMRALARACAGAVGSVRLRGMPEQLRRYWAIACMDQIWKLRETQN